MLVRRYFRQTAAPKWRVAKPHGSTTDDARKESLRILNSTRILYTPFTYTALFLKRQMHEFRIRKNL